MKVDRKKNVIRLGPADTKKWESGNPAGFAFRKSVRDLAYSIARATGKHVEIYASESAGGWMADQISAGSSRDES